MYSKRGTESALDLNYEFHQRQSAVSFRVLASPDGPRPPPRRLSALSLLHPPLHLVFHEPAGRCRVVPPPPLPSSLATHLAGRSRAAPARAIPFSAGTGDEKFWRRHKNAALHFPFKITPFAPFSVYYYQVVQPAFSALVHPSASLHRTPSPHPPPLRIPTAP